ncbi:MAG: SDR family oxidoreductase [Roseovarius sp.]|nr:SDR family oxidoreductase [Roseovarius sp.]
MFKQEDVTLCDLVAVITGGGQGIGEGIALNLASFGADIVIADKNPETAERTAKKVREIGRKALGLMCDIRNREDVVSVFERSMEEFGRVDFLVNNAGGVRHAAFLELGEQGWQKHLELNIMGVLTPTELAANAMIKGGRGGSIINISSIEASRAAPERSIYGMCKAGMGSLTRSLALELGPHNIRINVIAPDVVATPGLLLLEEECSGPPELMRSLQGYVPLGRGGNTDDIGGVCVFLASPLARYVTGTSIPVDGGTWASSGWTKDENGLWESFSGFGARHKEKIAETAHLRTPS